MGTITHTFQTAIPDDGTPAGGVGSDEWNAPHTLVGVSPDSAYLGSLALADGQFILQLARGVLVSTDRLTLVGTARFVDFGSTDSVVPNIIGVPRQPKVPVRLPDGYEARITGRYELRGMVRVSMEGTGELDLFEDLGTGRVVLPGSGRLVGVI
jgi:hypothetical protein